MDSFPTDAFLLALAGGFDWTATDVRLLLIDATSGHTLGPETATVAAITPFEYPGAGRAIVPVETRTVALIGRVVHGYGDDVVFADLGEEEGSPDVDGAWLYVNVDDDDSSSWPIAFIGSVTGAVNGTDFTVSFSSAGIFTIRPAA